MGRDGILARREGPLEVAVRRAPRGVRVLARNVGVSGRLTRLDLQDRVAVAPVEALQDTLEGLKIAATDDIAFLGLPASE